MQQVKRTHAVRCPVCGKGRVIDAAADVDRGACTSTARSSGQGGAVLQSPKCGLQIGIFF